MKVLIIGMSNNPGGIESFIEGYYDNLKEFITFDFMVFTETCVNYEKFISNGSKVFFIKSAQFKQYFKYKRELKDFFDNNGKMYDAIWVNSCDLANSNILNYAKKSGIPKRIIHSHNSQFIQSGKRLLFYKFMHKIMQTKISKMATDFWACSDLAGEFFYNESILKSNKYKIINNAIKISSFAFNDSIRSEYRKKLNLENKIVLGHVGRFHFQKNHQFLIDIFSEVVKKSSDYHLVLVGKGEDKEIIKEKVHNLNLDEHVTFLGVRDDVSNLMQAMDIFVFPSLFEGLSVVLVEVQASGLTCFASQEAAPKMAQITENIKVLSLSDSAHEWANSITNHIIKNNREKYYKDVRDAGYDIEHEALKVKKLLMED